MIWVLANIDAEGNWTPGLGDNTVFGWLITGAYLLTTILCIRAYRREDERFLRGGRGLRPRFWLVIAGAMCLLGLNKQLDLQTLVSFLGRRVAKSMGWYDQRREVQAVFLVVVGLLAAGAVAAIGWWIGSSWRRYWPAVVGAAYLCVFIMLRAASFHHVDTVLYRLPVVGLFVNRALELGGVVLIAWGAIRSARAPSRHAF